MTHFLGRWRRGARPREGEIASEEIRAFGYLNTCSKETEKTGKRETQKTLFYYHSPSKKNHLEIFDLTHFDISFLLLSGI